MILYKAISFVISICLLITSCTTTSIVSIDQNYSENNSENAVAINGHSIRENILVLDVTYKGCKRDTIQLITNGMYKKTNPPSIILVLNHKTSGEQCDKSISKILKFDISNLMLENTEQENTLMLNIENYPSTIKYVY